MKTSVLYETWFRRTFIGFLIVEVGFALVTWISPLHRANDWFAKHFSPEHILASQVTFLISLVHFLVMVNTAIFIYESVNVLMHVSKLTKKERRKARSIYGLIGTILTGCAVISGFFGLTYAKAWWAPETAPHDWLGELYFNEYGLIVLFILFVVAESLLLHLCTFCKTHLGNDPAASEVQDFHNTTQKYLKACDWPGLIGVLLIFVLSHGVPTDGEELHPYVMGFITGALALHVTFSQAVLAFLSEPDRAEEPEGDLSDCANIWSG